MASNVANIAEAKRRALVKFDREYVTGSSWFTTQPHALPPIHDDNECSELSDKQIEQMMADPDVFSAILLLALMAFSEKLQITPCYTVPPEQQASIYNDAQPQKLATDPQATPQTAPQPSKPVTPPIDPKVKQAGDVAEFCERMIKGVAGFSGSMFQLVFEGLKHGNKVAEVIWEIAASGDDAGKWILKAVKPKPRFALAFVVDPYMNVLGFLGAKPGQWSTVPFNTIVNPKDIIPREKFAVFTYRPKDDDPRGQTICNAARNGWDLKRRAFPEYLLFLMVSAIPGILATLPSNAMEQIVYEDDGITPKIDPATGEVVKISAAQFLLTLLGKMRNHQVAVAPDGTNFTMLEANSKGEIFDGFFRLAKKEITLAILLQELATKDSEHQTKNATGSQFRIVDLIVWFIRDLAANVVRYDILKPLIRYNFGDEIANEYLPDCSYGDTEARDWAQDATAVSQLKDALTESQVDFVLTQLGIPLPTAAERAERQKRKEIMQSVMQSGNQQQQNDNSSGNNKAGQSGNTGNGNQRRSA